MSTTADAERVFLTGVVEGYYGRPWPDAIRLAYADYLVELGMNTMLYCPKADPCLRKAWQANWSPERWVYLQAVSRCYRERGLIRGPGLSPFALYQAYDRPRRRALRDKVRRLLELQPGVLAILFDDMPGDVADLARRQAEIVCDVSEWAGGLRTLVCPTYYSFDPVLEKHFGARPADYWSRLGQALPDTVDVFWTGDAVCSDVVSTAGIEAITDRLGRPPLLWDNYPVNDGAVRSRFLYCFPPSGRDPELRDALRGHLCNPMNQALLSLPALAGLASLYGRPVADDCWLARTLGEQTWTQLQRDREEFCSQGLDGLGEPRRSELARRYAALPGAAAAEVAGWLRGEYTFDPACLTE